MIIKSKK